jgi:hypothetical protein
MPYKTYSTGTGTVPSVIHTVQAVPVPTKRIELASGLFAGTTVPVPGTVLPSHLAFGLHGTWIHPIN